MVKHLLLEDQLPRLNNTCPGSSRICDRSCPFSGSGGLQNVPNLWP